MYQGSDIPLQFSCVRMDAWSQRFGPRLRLRPLSTEMVQTKYERWLSHGSWSGRGACNAYAMDWW